MTATTKTKPKTKTVRLSSGARVRLSADGRIQPAPELEWRLQAAAVTALKKLPSYESLFLLAGDMNAGKRNAAKAKSNGLTAGEPDLRIYIKGGRLLLLELKAAKTPVSKDQRDRHKALAALGHKVLLIRAGDGPEMAAKVCAAVAFELAWWGLVIDKDAA